MLSKVLPKNEALQIVLKIVLGVAILFCCSQISLPLKPVPITMQTVGVLLIGLFYERRQALMTMLSYITLGVAGLPVFTHGTAYIIGGPTTGYLLGFLAASIAMPLFREWVKKETPWTMFINCLLGTTFIYALGVAWLASLFGFEKAIQVGLVPFIIPGCIKAVLLSQAVRFIRR
jgi:biotin transport system substrate-specific component